MSIVLGREKLAEFGLPAPDSAERLDRRARSTFSKIPSDTPLQANGDPFDVLELSAQYLDQWRALAGVAEAATLSHVSTYGQAINKLDEILTRARLLTRIDPLAVFFSDPAVQEAARRSTHKPAPDDPFPVVMSATFLRLVSSLIEYCPIEDLVDLGERLGHPELGHRCRLSYDWLRAFIRRSAPGSEETLHILGRAYTEKRLSLEEAAHLLSMPRADAVAWLEEFGHARDLDMIRLGEQEKEHRLTRIRNERLARAGKPRVNPLLVTRDVIATQRIEGVDARPWLQPGV